MNKLKLAICLLSLALPLFSQSQDLSRKERHEQLRQAVDNRIEDFLTNMRILADKSEDDWVREESRKEAGRYFSKDAWIEVSNVNRPGRATPYPFDTYLRRFMNLNYYRIDLKLKHISTSDVTEVRDNVYRLTGIYQQEFSGFKKGSDKPVYGDITLKEIEVKVDKVKDIYNGSFYYTIQFNYIKVLQTLELD